MNEGFETPKPHGVETGLDRKLRPSLMVECLSPSWIDWLAPILVVCTFVALWREDYMLGLPCLFVSAATWAVMRKRRAKRKLDHWRLRTALKSSLDPYLVTDPAAEIIFASYSVKDVFGWSPTELIGKNISCLMPESFASEHDGHIATFKVTGATSLLGNPRELWGMRKDGGTFPCEVTVSPMIQKGGEIVGFVGVLRDISQRRRDELALRNASAEAEAANEAKSRFLAGANHELLTPLTSILAFSEILGAEKGASTGSVSADSEVREFTRIIHAEAKRMSRLVQDLLDVGKLQSGEYELSRELFNLRALVDACVASVVPRALTKQVTLEVEACHDEVLFFGDRERLQQVILNIVVNAIKFSPDGSRVVCRVDVEADSVALRVCDRGCGIPEGDREKIFESFYQSKSGENEARGGSGLGLAIARSIVERHGGTIVAEGRPSGGTEIVVSLPISSLSRSDCVLV